MSSRTRVLGVYDDAPVFGGHEQMSCAGIDALAAMDDLRLVCMFYRGNEKLRSKLESVAQRRSNVKLVELDIQSRKFQGIRSHFQNKAIQSIADVYRNEKVEAALILQGDIELSSLGVLAANRLNIPAVSYIPVPHTLATMKAKLGAFRDPFNSWLFRKPDSFITISEGMKKLLQERGATQSIEVVLNGFDPSKTEKRNPAEARARLNLPAGGKLVGMVGRIEYKQKRQDFLLECFAENRSQLPNVHLVFVGSGPKTDDLKRYADELKVTRQVSFIEWTDGLSDVYSALDVLAIPSRFEGVPLVMLEAMSVEIPIVASARDGMKEFLPGQWLFEPGDKAACAQCLSRVLIDDQSDLTAMNRSRALQDFTMAKFGSSFVNSVRRLGNLG
jgi:glycosyltransferase involved in cell wall biosynthesis